MNKQTLRQELLQRLDSQRTTALNAATSAHDAATHEQSVAETQYDTIGLEAAYLAHGQSQRVIDCDRTIHRVNALNLQDFNNDDCIEYGALVTLSNHKNYWLLPVCGGTLLDHGRITVITPQAPLGQMLDGAEFDEILANGLSIIEIQ
ncbi:hypothetical protein ACFODT_13815 [Vibrio zhugei]|uniref:Transcription elongation factor n=1 Tax=Vibrio zhugei TaxID=2479546 RepID=A0ABV7CDF5_9VIBR|nr:hypothetical protein [Vibrio zhugei]